LRRSLAFLGLVALLGACDGTTSDRGLDARMRIKGAQFVRGAMPAGSPSGPAVASVTLPNNDIRASFIDDPISGALDPAATAAAIGIDGDTGYWIVTAGVPQVATPDNPSFAALASFAADLAPGAYTLVVRAADGNGGYGPPHTVALTAEGPIVVTGAFVITLAWDTEADLDLHVVDPLGNELRHGSPSSQPPPPFVPDPDAGASYGYLDFDSNASCVIDGRRVEDVLWPNPPPSGHYVVRVDTASMCGQPIAHWTVTATLEGTVVGRAAGTSLDVDSRGPHDRGAGLTALELDVP
jgi:hypothetical protein